jgi:sigma-B regulation protein RsbU (phosphoserine phosphatase)
VTLGPGDQLLIVTDGITEAMDPSQLLFGEDRVAGLMGQNGPPDTTLLLRLLADVREFEAGGLQSDDIAALSLRIVAE